MTSDELSDVIQEGDRLTIQFQATAGEALNDTEYTGDYDGGHWPRIHDDLVIASIEEIVKVTRREDGEKKTWIADEVVEWVEESIETGRDSNETQSNIQESLVERRSHLLSHANALRGRGLRERFETESLAVSTEETRVAATVGARDDTESDEAKTTPYEYECSCGNVVEIKPDNFDNLHWATNKFGYNTTAELIEAETDCCDRPKYTERRLWSDGC